MPDAVWGMLERLLARLPRRAQRALNQLPSLYMTARSIAGYAWRRRDRRRLELAGWMIPAAAAGWLFGSELSSLVAFATRALLGLSPRGGADGAWAVPLAVIDWTTYDLLVSVAQALVLRRYVPAFSARRWIIASVAGSILAAALVVGWYDRSGASGSAAGAGRIVLWGLCLALPQWWVLRPHVGSRAGAVWLLARILGDSAATELRGAVGAMWTALAGPAGQAPLPVGPLNVLPLVVAGAAFGAVTGAALAAILRPEALRPAHHVGRTGWAGWRFWLSWALATVIATALAAEALNLLEFALRGHRVVDGQVVPGSRGGLPGAVLLSLVHWWIQGLAIGTGQWLVLRTRVPAAHAWVRRTALGYLGGFILSSVAFGTGTVLSALEVLPDAAGVTVTLVGLAVRGATVGWAQERLLRTVTRRSRAWIAANAAAFVLGSYPGVALTFGVGVAAMRAGYSPWVLATLSIGLLNGLILGGVMTWLLRRPMRPGAIEDQ